MSYFDLLMQDLTPLVSQAKSQLRATDLYWRIAFILYVISSLQFTKRQVRRLVRTLPTPAAPNPEDQFISVTAEEMRSYRDRSGNYDVPREFPPALEKYTTKPSAADFAQWILELGHMDEARLLDAKRAITASAAFHDVRIPKVLRMVDNRTKALWVRLDFDMALRAVSEQQVHQEVTNMLGKCEQPDLDACTYAYLMPSVGTLILAAARVDEFPCLSVFSRNLTGYGDVLKGMTLLNTRVIQSLATAYAVKSGLKIPASYVRCDHLTLQLLASTEPVAA